MKQLLPYLLVIILTLLWVRECNRQPETKTITRTVTVTVPEIRHTFDTIYINKPVLIHEIDSLYKERYLTAKDSLERLKMYLDAITVREYSQTFEDSVQKVDVWSKTRGELLEQSVSYHVFERTISQTDTIAIPQSRSLYLLPQIGTNRERFKASGSLIYVDRKNRLYSLSYDSDGYIMGGYGIKF